jgi:glucose/mannose-6-phosphate isomerase
MEEQILHFADQFSWEPKIENEERLPENTQSLIVCGMGGSHLGARLLLRHDPTLDIRIHSDYGLPTESAERLRSSLIVASSYSGETEEILDAARAASDAGLAVAAVTTGGALAKLARERKLPLILLEKQSVEPRMAVGASMLALARLMRASALEEEIRATGAAIDVHTGETEGTALAERLTGSIPVVYASTLNTSLAYFWKIAFNETGKIPAFYNLFPEVCHNELSGFDAVPSARDLSSSLHILQLHDADDHPRIVKRMRIMRELLEARGVSVTTVELAGHTGLEKALYGVLAGIWTAVAVAKTYHAPDAATPLIAEFKKEMLES